VRRRWRIEFAIRVLLCIHHWLDPNAGAPGLTLSLGDSLEAKGCTVDYFAFDHAYGRRRQEQVHHQVRFPWQVARQLTRRARHFDVIDASTGDAWLWATLRRPGNRRSALMTRSHGLEHTIDEELRQAASALGPPLSWKYPLYHGGWRLWEVKRSLLLADRCILANSRDLRRARDRLGVPPQRLTILPYGIADHFHRAASVDPGDDGPLRLAFAGSWIPRKGIHTLVDAVNLLHRQGVDFSVTLLGTGESNGVLSSFPEDVRPRVEVVPSFDNRRLPELLTGHRILLFPSVSEGSSGAMAEGMACGLAPVATEAGIAPDVIEHGRNGMLVEVGDARGMAENVARLARDRPALLEMRRRAQETARELRWEQIAASTLSLYEQVLAERSQRPT
jgi:glycosyltransferase involved in cell wall biosynthesis